MVSILESAQEEHISCMELINDQLLVLGYLDGSVAVIEVNSGRKRGKKTQFHSKEVTSLAATVDYRVFSAAGDGSFLIGTVDSESLAITKVKQAQLASPVRGILLPSLVALNESFMVALRTGETLLLSLSPLTLLSVIP